MATVASSNTGQAPATPPPEQLSFAQIEALWVSNGGDPNWAPTMAGIAMAESGGRYKALNNNPSTGDYSVGLWQINYYGDLLGPRTKTYGDPASLQADPNAQAKAAIDLLGGGGGIGAWRGDTVGNYAQNGQPLSIDQVTSILGSSYTAGALTPLQLTDPATLTSFWGWIGSNLFGLGGAAVFGGASLNPFKTVTNLSDATLGIVKDIGSGFGIGWSGILSIILGGIFIIIGIAFIFHKQAGQIIQMGAKA